MTAPTPQQLLATALRHYQSGQFQQADRFCRYVLAQQPDHPYALHLLAALAHQAGRNDIAEQLVRRAIAVHPADAQFHNTLGAVLISMKRNEDAVRALRQATFLRSGFAEAHNNMGTALQNLGRYDEAIACFRKSAALDPSSAETHYNHGNALQEKLDFAGAADAYTRAIPLRPAYHVAVRGLVTALTKSEQLDGAIAIARELLSTHPDDPEMRWRLAWALLLKGDLVDGWKEFESRAYVDQALPHRRTFAQPRWRGEPLQDRWILLYPEQGIGDTIQFARFIPQVIALGGRVLLECQPSLFPLLKELPGVQQVIAEGQPLPAFDVQCPIMSLGDALGVALDQLPETAAPYLRADAQRVERWRTFFPQSDARLKVGIVWAGNADHSNDRHRSFALSTFAPLGRVEGVQFFSLQKGSPAAQIMTVAELSPIDLGSKLIDFADTAAVLECLDLLITADTAIAHLAGAMGKPVWVLVPTPPDWRWMLGRADSPWYPSMRLFRQLKPGDWSEPVRQVVEELQRIRP